MQTMTNHEADPMQTIYDLIDQMVDGGMTPDELCRSIERLDAAPEGWRRCALAFLEAQSWADAFRSMDGTIAGDALRTPADSPAQSLTTLNPEPITSVAAPRGRLIVAALAA